MSLRELEAAEEAVSRVLAADLQEVEVATEAADHILAQPELSAQDLINWWKDHGPQVRRWLGRLEGNFFTRLLGFFARFIGALCRLGNSLADLLDRLAGVDTREGGA